MHSHEYVYMLVKKNNKAYQILASYISNTHTHTHTRSHHITSLEERERDLVREAVLLLGFGCYGGIIEQVFNVLCVFYENISKTCNESTFVRRMHFISASNSSGRVCAPDMKDSSNHGTLNDQMYHFHLLD